MIDVDEALAILARSVRPLPATTVGLDLALGRTLAEQIRADRDFPPTDRSAMDGFAVRAEDLPREGIELELIGEVPAGQAPNVTVRPGSTVRIFTGAVVPEGADTVVMVERTEERNRSGKIRFAIRPEIGQHIRRQGQDLLAGEVVLEAGVPIHAPEIAALASVGRVEVPVHRAPRVRVLSTGDEVVEPAEEPLPHQIRNSNAGTLLAQLHEMGIAGEYLGIAGDDGDALDRGLARGLEADLLLITGGVSVGKYDLVADALARAGMELLFHKVAIKPGKPILVGRRAGCLVIGLPGNPVSTYCGFELFVAPALRRLSGRSVATRTPVRAELAGPLRNKPGRRTFHLARLEFRGARFVAIPVATTGSGDLLSMVRANAFLITDADQGDCPAGTLLDALPWREFDLR